jgi:hypothetical protein
MANKTGKKSPKSGRKKGVPNKRTMDTMALAEQIIQETGCHPVEVLLRGTAGDWKFFGFEEKSLKIGKATVRDNITFEDRIACAEKAAKYVSPQLKAMEHSGQIKTGGLLAEIMAELEEDEPGED